MKRFYLKILFYGTGVIGSIFAAKLALSKNDVTVLARGQRLKDIETNGIILQHAISGKEIRVKVKAVDSLGINDQYDLIIVPVRTEQIDSILPILAQNNKTPVIMFIVNNPAGYEKWSLAVGKERVIVGFPGAGGRVKGQVVEYVLVSRILQPTTIGEVDGSYTPRIKKIAQMIRRAGFPVSISDNMDAWQKTHVAWVTPCAFAIYRSMEQGKSLSQCPEVVRNMIRAIREGFGILKDLNIPVTPSKLQTLEWLPEHFLVWSFTMWARTTHFETVALRHSLNARIELENLAAQFMELAKTSSLPTPYLTDLYRLESK